MTPETINLRSKTFLIEMLKLMKLEGDRQGEPITNSWLSEPNWQNKLLSLESLKEILNYAHKIANEILTIQGKKKLDPGHFEFENDEQHFKFLRMNNEDQKDIIQNLKNSLQGGANYKQQNEQILTNLKNILGDNLTDWETKLAKKTDLDQANNSLTQLANEKSQLQQQITNFINQLNDLNNGNKNKEELEQKIKQLTTELEQAQNKEPSRTNEPSDYQDIKNELEQLRKQAVNSQDKELVKKIAELTDKINQRERERERTKIPRTSRTSRQSKDYIE